MKKYSEEEIARALLIYLNRQGHEIWTEVQMPSGRRADVVSRKDGFIHVWEVKRRFNYTLLEQLYDWASNDQYRPHYIHAVVEYCGKLSNLTKRLLKDNRVGVWTLSSFFEPQYFSDQGNPKYERWSQKSLDWPIENNDRFIPRIQPGSKQTAKHLLDHLCDDMKKSAPGVTPDKAYISTPYKRTFRAAEAAFRELYADSKAEVHVDHVIEKLVEGEGHHYCSVPSARSGLLAAFTRNGYGVKFSRITPP